jgi:DNA-binding XRE family transcriptional regulator
VNPRNKAQLDKMSPEKRAKAEAMIARHNTPEAKARHYEAIEAVEREVRETGGITTADGTLHKVRPAFSDDDWAYMLVCVGRTLRELRLAEGLSLDDVARQSGVDSSAIAKIERGVNPNPTIGTLARVAMVCGRRLGLTFKELPPIERN